MANKWNADDLMRVHSGNLDRYKKNYLKQAVCEFRFPTLMELGEAKPPSSFVKALRKEYPHLELTNELTVGLTGSNGFNNTHVFKSNKGKWSISLRQNSVVLETTAYTTFDEMKLRILKMVDAAIPIIDSNFFTRIGLRYINILNGDPTEGWINPQLVGPLLGNTFTGVSEYSGRLLVSADDGGCLLQHALKVKGADNEKDIDVQYLIDIDAYREQIEIKDAASALDVMHSQAFDVFDWAVGDKAREFLAS